MSKKRSIELLNDYEKALERLHEGCSMSPDHTIVVDGVIQRFEFTFELCWKLLQSVQYLHGLEVKSPRQAIKQAYQMQIIQEGDAWIDMLMDRNRTSHIYDEEQSQIIYHKIVTTYIHLLDTVKDSVRSLLNSVDD
jgi:nucleotidyltransferase substrate binding protein (TIGR01987 family)